MALVIASVSGNMSLQRFYGVISVFSGAASQSVTIDHYGHNIIRLSEAMKDCLNPTVPQMVQLCNSNCTIEAKTTRETQEVEN